MAKDNMNLSEARRINNILATFTPKNLDVKGHAVLKAKEMAFKDYIINL